MSPFEKIKVRTEGRARRQQRFDAYHANSLPHVLPINEYPTTAQDCAEQVPRYARRRGAGVCRGRVEDWTGAGGLRASLRHVQFWGGCGQGRPRKGELVRVKCIVSTYNFHPLPTIPSHSSLRSSPQVIRGEEKNFGDNMKDETAKSAFSVWLQGRVRAAQDELDRHNRPDEIEGEARGNGGQWVPREQWRLATKAWLARKSLMLQDLLASL